MCGIAGWVARPDEALNEATRAAMLKAMAHRGPDGEGMFVARDAAPAAIGWMNDRFKGAPAPSSCQ